MKNGEIRIIVVFRDYYIIIFRRISPNHQVVRSKKTDFTNMRGAGSYIH
ncbi:MAG: hypothetical protein RIQ79_1174 [Verrucomicrobiota bacterium]